MFLTFTCIGQTKLIPKADFNTFFVCIDTLTYSQLFQSRYVRDTLFLCREIQQETNADSYVGKYLIGESATIEFFQPKESNQLGDHYGDWGIEFKTRKINDLDIFIKKSQLFTVNVDTSTNTTILDSLPILWYKTLGFKTSKNELTILEYQAEYLQNLGFTKTQINKSMTFKEYNSILSQGKKYPRQFTMITYVKLFADKKLIENLQNFATLNNYRKIKNGFSNNETLIEYEEVISVPEFPIQRLDVSLLNTQKYRMVEISKNLSIKTEGKKASFIFKGNH